ncbi:LOW QUALITY PROTEIN: hypothetical protein ACHAWF_001009, partial [Thalassiosira exigua]
KRATKTDIPSLFARAKKRQAISSRWGAASSSSSVASSLIHDRHECRWSHAVNGILTRRRERIVTLPYRAGTKRAHSVKEQEDFGGSNCSEDKLHPLTRIGDVLAVNLLILLKGSAAMRLHHWQRSAATSLGPTSRMSSWREPRVHPGQSGSAADSEVPSEIRASAGRELVLQLHAKDAVAFYYSRREYIGILGCGSSGKSVHLLPRAKMMLRLHLFGRTNKPKMYEQA